MRAGGAWAAFRAHRRGWWSLIALALLVGVTLPAEFVANDRPLLVRLDGGFLVPVLTDVPETALGGEFPTNADFRDPVVQALVHDRGGWMVWPPVPFGPDSISHGLPGTAPTPPDGTNLLGTDDQGRDVLARLIHGFRLSVLFGIACAVLSAGLGILIGAVQGYFGGWVDLAGQRLVEIWSGIPVLFLLIVLGALVEPNALWLLLVLWLFGWMGLVGVVRTEVLRTRAQDHVRAARALGAGDGRILARHILPNALTAALTMLPFLATGAVSTLAALDFLGFGLPPGTASLGELLRQGKANLDAPWLGLTAFLALALTLTLLVFIGEAARDALDPRRSRR
ncbi:MAG: hypothetical protein RLY86_2885 [Pseudomonadota bacterium]|jgi:microcin C transport system permease protein